MSRYRAFALRASLAAVLAATMGAVTLATGPVSAAPDNPAAAAANPYPPAPPKLTVSRGSVRAGQTVIAYGRRYLKDERVTITVRFKRKGSSTFRTVSERIIRADRKGRFYVSVKLAREGTVTIKGRGRTSGQSSTVYVKVTRGKNSNSWNIRLASFTPGAPTAASPVAVARSGAPEQTPAAGFAIAGLGAMALIGSAAVTHRVVRRRRRTGAAA